MQDLDMTIKAWEIFRDSNPYEICHGKEFRAIKDPEYCMGQMIADTLEHLKKRKGLVMSLKQSNSVNKYLNQTIEVLENKLKGKKQKGHWSNISTVKGDTYKRCSCCFYVCNGWDIETGIEYYFCPNCGADMRKDGEQE